MKSLDNPYSNSIEGSLYTPKIRAFLKTTGALLVYFEGSTFVCLYVCLRPPSQWQKPELGAEGRRASHSGMI